MLTEKEAKTKEGCGPGDCGFSNDGPYSARWCVASNCMAWRWKHRGSGYDPGGTGYCGLAGGTV